MARSRNSQVNLLFMMEVTYILERNRAYYESLMKEISVKNDIDGKGILNKNINKLYKARKYVKGKQHFEEIVIRCQVIIEKMSNLEHCIWKIGELSDILNHAIDYYSKGYDNSISEFYNNFPKYKSVDGHCLRSKSELIIDLWLCYHRINHEYEKPIKKQSKLIAKCDFYLPVYNCYIEYWGIEGDNHYENNKKNKILMYESLNLKLVSLYPDDLENLESKLSVIRDV